jgi:gamma-glutamyl:cysteine ligase YbdK (ATP-grasp superfamily)
LEIMMSDASPLHLFEGVGIELEYMLIDRETLAVAPASDRLLRAVGDTGEGDPPSEVERGVISWSNELVLHVLELKTTEPEKDLTALPERFQEEVRAALGILKPWGLGILPGAMHPTMDPATETRLWPYGYSAVYAAYDRIFDCQGHGWSNLQSTHINLPFSGDEEFARLHAAIRLVLPLLPGLAASSPVIDGRANGLLDNRLEVYRRNHRNIPEVTAAVIPERVHSEAEYDHQILEPLYEAIAPHDPEGILRNPWLNARGAIARFDRGSIEIRLVDSQECPLADLAVSAAVVAVVRQLVEERFSATEAQREIDTGMLADLLHRGAIRGERAVIESAEYLELFGVEAGHLTTGGLWRHLLDDAFYNGLLDDVWEEPLEVVLEEGPLARRLLESLGPEPGPEAIQSTWRELASCLEEGTIYSRRLR